MPPFSLSHSVLCSLLDVNAMEMKIVWEKPVGRARGLEGSAGGVYEVVRAWSPLVECCEYPLHFQDGRRKTATDVGTLSLLTFFILLVLKENIQPRIIIITVRRTWDTKSFAVLVFNHKTTPSDVSMVNIHGR